MTTSNCLICGWRNSGKLCEKHKLIFSLDKKLQVYRLKKKYRGSRYTNLEYHKHEISLTKILEKFYGKKDIITGVHPLWAISKKKVLLEYDICIISRKILVEYSGEQHYKLTPFWHKTNKEFKDQQKRDRLKSKLALKNGYKLVVLRYDEPFFKDYIINKLEGTIWNK